MSETGPMGNLPHLAGPAAPVRQVLAAHFLRDCPHVIEIGGHLLPITSFLTHRPESVLVVDPKTVPYAAETLRGASCRIRHVACKFQELNYDYRPLSYGLVMLGYSMKAFGKSEPVGAKLLDLVDNARRVIIEWPPSLERASLQVPYLLARPQFNQLCRIDLTLEDGTIEHSDYAQRRMIVLENKSAIAQETLRADAS